MDAAASVCDVLSFYQERLANEGYLRTATERRSLVKLGQLIGYTLKPGVSASTYLAYTIDENTREEVLIPAGSRAQTVPGPDELPQTFETRDDLLARARWNRLLPRQTRPQTLEDVVRYNVLHLAGISTQLKPGDPLLIGDGGTPTPFRVRKVEIEADKLRTRVTVGLWQGPTTTRIVRTLRARMMALRDGAPTSKTARSINTLLSQALEANERPEALKEQLESELTPAIGAALAQLSPRAPRVREWLESLQHELAADIAPVNGPALPPLTAIDFSSPLIQLARLGAIPLANSLRLPADLRQNFKASSDAGLGITAAGLGDGADATAALAGFGGASEPSRLAVFALKLKTGLFGRTFQMEVTSPSTAESGYSLTEWTLSIGDGAEQEQEDVIHLEGSHDGILPDSWIMLDRTAVAVQTGRVTPTAETVLITKVEHVTPKLARAAYGSTAETTRVGLLDRWIKEEDRSNDGPLEAPEYDDSFQIIRKTPVYAQSEQLALAPLPVTSSVCTDADSYLELDGLYTELQPGRFVIVSGERADIESVTGVRGAETVMISDVVHDVSDAVDGKPLSLSQRKEAKGLPGDKVHTFVRVYPPLRYCYQRATVAIHANVVRATHGETRNELLGSGDASRPAQAFALKQKPLTYLAAVTPVGSESTLQVFVDDVRWHEVPSALDQSATARVFSTSTDDEDNTTVSFGDGIEGARLPTGLGNVRASYRSGIGKAGNARAGQIGLLGSRPLGVREVTNPLRATGGADRESRDRARQSLPISVHALDRLVSPDDYAYFARNFAGIDKADAVELSDGTQSLVHVTIAGVGDIPIDRGSELHESLVTALRTFGDPLLPVRLVTRELLLLTISANLSIELDYLWENVVVDVRRRLLEAFGFDARALGQPVYSSELLSVMQSVPGVAYVDLDTVGAISTTAPVKDGQPPSERPPTPEEIAELLAEIIQKGDPGVLQASAARNDNGVLRPAQLIALSHDLPATLVLNQIK